jgi:hypothetical protein
MSLITSFNTDENFWVLNPQFKNVQPFKSLHNSDKSRGKGTSSKTMWFVAQVEDNSGSNIFRNLQRDERIGLLAEDYMEDRDFYDNNQELLDKLCSTYASIHTTPAQLALQEWNQKIIERAQFIKNTPYEMDKYEMDARTGKPVLVKGTAKDLDAMMKNTKSIYDQYHEILKSLDKEDEATQVKGGQQLSLSDTGDI